jgi:hypothetical protein
MLASEGSEQITEVRVTDDDINVSLADGRTLSVPLVWYPSLLNASEEERNDWRLIGDGEGIHWPQIDEDLSAAGMLRGIPALASRPRTLDEIAAESFAQAVRNARNFFVHSLGEAEGQLQSTRTQLQDFAKQQPGWREDTLVQIQEMLDSLYLVENRIDQAAEDLGLAQQLQDTAGQAAQQAQDTAGQAAQQAQDVGGGAAQEIVGQVADQAQEAVGQVADRARLSRL